MRVCIGNPKGGAGKTLTAVMLALGLAFRWPEGHAYWRPWHGRVLLIDADPQQPQCLAYMSQAGADWPAAAITVLRCASRNLAAEVTPHLASYDHVVIDTGAKNVALLRQAMEIADHLIIPCRTSSGDIREIIRPDVASGAGVLQLAAEVDAVHPITAEILLTNVPTHVGASNGARKVLADHGVPVMRSQVRFLQLWANAIGTAPAGPELADYYDVVQELMGAEVAA
jgi:cellulose biosynthesis protein BcsQ